MAKISSLNNNYDLYNSPYSSKKNGSTGNIFSDLGNNTLKDLAMIKKGSYKRLLSAYYDKYGNEGASSQRDGIAGEVSNLKKVASDSNNLKDSVSRLRRMDFSKDEDGEKSVAAAKDFAESYNALIDSSVNVNRRSVLKDTLSLVNYMKKNAGMLNELGMKLGSDNKI